MIPTTLLNTLTNSKAKDIQVLDVEKQTPLMDKLIICTATSSRHAKSIGEALIKFAKAKNAPPKGVEGFDRGEWILINLNTTVVHIMLAEQRNIYQLDKLWSSDTTTTDANNNF